MSGKRVKINKGIKRLLNNLALNNIMDEKDVSFLDRYPKALDKYTDARIKLFRKYPDFMKLI